MRRRRFLNEKSWERDFGDLYFDYDLEGIDWDTDEVYEDIKKIMGIGLFKGGLFDIRDIEDYLSKYIGTKVKCAGCGAYNKAFTFVFKGSGIRFLRISILF